jgi:L-alanine-DL-glutamate epimerase-like enolase superfamily enzyme
MKSAVAISSGQVSTYVVPTDSPESDGTFCWSSTTMVLVSLAAGDQRGLGYTYSNQSAAALADRLVREHVLHCSALDIGLIWSRLVAAVRNMGRPGIAASAISAIDTALWDLKAKLLGVPLVKLWGQVRDSAPVYGSGGFTSYSIDRLQQQFSEWREAGIQAAKMKVGRDPERDVERVRAAREAAGGDMRIMVDANGAYSRREALAKAHQFAEYGVTWFEEPVSSDDLEGLRFLRQRVPPGMEIAAGEYGYDPWYFQRMLAARAIDVLQADATRSCGFTGFGCAAALCLAHQTPLSAHTAPALHAHIGCALPSVRDIEFFHDHVRIERMVFEGVPQLVKGQLRLDLSRAGMGLEFKEADAPRFAA